ncbi:VOC family protein [Dokdonella soli]|uniref:VOC family protein n=1 Tax=Dokdonella soli TaxID=529810 RepID=A0ABN1IJ12_9GAMM
MIDHIGIAVSDYAKSKAFYERALAPLGIGLMMEVTPEQTGDGSYAAGFGAQGKPFFWISSSSAQQGRTHVAFTAPSRTVVDAFHRTALVAGGRDNGAPGLRPHYHQNYYGAFVRDPDGHNVEAVCHMPGGQI